MKETLRDKRTLIRVMLLPLLIYPILLFITSTVMESQKEKSMAAIAKVAYYDFGQNDKLREYLSSDPGIRVGDIPENLRQAVENNDQHAFDSILKEMIKEEEIDLAVFPDQDFSKTIGGNKKSNIKVYFSSTGDQIIKDRIKEKLEHYEQIVLAQRFENAALDREFAEGFDILPVDVASQKEQFGRLVGGFLPYFFIIFCFMGSMYPAIDLAAGEKERGTIETILTTPVTKLQILLGKIGVVALTGISSAIVSMLGIFLSLKIANFIPPEILNILYSLINPVAVFLILLILLPLTIFFASFLISISIYSRSFKEAQSTITPLLIFIILPAFIGIFPGIKLNAITALIPILNVSLITKEVMAGTLDYLLYLEAFASLILLAGVSLIFAIRWFNRESNILR